MKIKWNKKTKRALLGVLAFLAVLAVQWVLDTYFPEEPEVALPPVTLSQVPAYSGEPFVIINRNEPYFTQEELTGSAYEYYGPLDDLGRCTVTMACLSRELMPTQSRGDISSVKPSGWSQKFYDFVDGEALYNRCHLIGHQLAGEDANEFNLITGTRYMNVEGMLPFENMLADYLREFDHHVIYRVTPLFEGDELVARGVLLEARSIEDDGICFCVFVYNVQPGVEIDYATGKSRLAD